MSSAISNTFNAQNFLLELPNELLTKVICHTDESDWAILYVTCKKIRTVMDESKPLLIDERDAQRKSVNAHLNAAVYVVFSQSFSPVVFDIPSADKLNTLLIAFKKCRSPNEKMRAFSSVLQATNATDDIAIQFYKALPEGRVGKLDASKTSFRHHIWIASGHADNGFGLGCFGDHVIASAPRGPLAIRGAHSLHSELLKKSIENLSQIISTWIYSRSN